MRNQRGWTLVELSISLAIMAVTLTDWGIRLYMEHGR